MSEKSMSASLFAAIARMSRFRSAVSFFIDFPFMGLGSASRDNTNNFLASMFMERVHNQLGSTPNRLRQPLSSAPHRQRRVSPGDRIRIVENEHGRLEANIMLVKVLRFLFSSHSKRMIGRARNSLS